MSLWSRISTWINRSAAGSSRPEVLKLKTALDEGRRRKRAGDYDGALSFFERAMRIAHDLKDEAIVSVVELHRADLYIKQARWEDARTLLQRLENIPAADAPTDSAATISPAVIGPGSAGVQRAYALVSLGTLAQARGDDTSAQRYYERAIDTAQSARAAGAEGRAKGYLGSIYLNEGNASYAMHLLNEALSLLNTSGDAELSSLFVGLMGEAEIISGRPREGHRLISRALRLADHVQYRQFQRRWHAALGRIALEDARAADAYNHYERALQLHPEDEAEALDVYRQLARACVLLNKNEDALVYAKEAVELDPTGVETRGMMGVVLRAAGRSAEALPYLEAAAAERPKPETLRHLAAARADVGDIPAAEAIYQRARQQAERDNLPLEMARAQRDLGMFYVHQGQLNAAIKAWTAALEYYDQQDFHAQVARLYCDIANLRFTQGQVQRAMKDYEQALMRLGQINDIETRGVVLSNAATAYVDRGDLETAESFLAESIQIAQKLRDERAEATRQGNFGWFLLATGRTKRALAALEYARQQSRRQHMALHIAVQTTNIGLAQAELDDHAAALESHREALDLIRPLDAPYWQAVIRANLARELLRDPAPDYDAITALIDNALADSARADSIEVRIRVLGVRAALLLRQDDLEQGGVAAQEAVALSRRLGAQRLLAESLIVCSQWRAMRGDDARALELWREAHDLLTLLHHPAGRHTPDWITAINSPDTAAS